MAVTAIIVAAGSGSRFGSDIPKQFLDLNGKPVIIHTLERFQAAPSVDSIVLVLSAERSSDFDQRPVSKLAAVVTGGDSRSSSVLKGLDAVDEATEIVAVHDGARPLVSIDEIERTIAKAKETGAACLTAKVTDTIKSIRGGEIAATLDRDKMRRALTPQAFSIDVLRRAFENSQPDEKATDECYLVEKLGYPIANVEGSGRNIKITQAEDLILASALLASEQNQ